MVKKTLIKDTTKAMLCHAVAFFGLAFPLGNIIAPLLIWLVWRKKSEFVNHHGKESIHFQISFTLCYLLLVILSFALAFDDVIVFTGGILGLFAMVFCFMQILNAAASAKRGERSTYPLTIRIIKFKPGE
ncbi:MAG: DUF4870 domain-containing protein [Desulfobacterales bacterium]|nr:DUF4870 domain-containing protein [Desulfobacterales bacterium]